MKIGETKITKNEGPISRYLSTIRKKPSVIRQMAFRLFSSSKS